MSSFRNMCQVKGITDDDMFELFINGDDWSKKSVSFANMMSRGCDLKLLLDAWLQRW